MSFSVITHSIWSIFYSNCCTIIKIRYRNWSHLFICSKCLIHIIDYKLGCYRLNFNMNCFIDTCNSIPIRIIIRHIDRNWNFIHITLIIHFTWSSFNSRCMVLCIIRITQSSRQTLRRNA